MVAARTPGQKTQPKAHPPVPQDIDRKRSVAKDALTKPSRLRVQETTRVRQQASQKKGK